MAQAKTYQGEITIRFRIGVILDSLDEFYFKLEDIQTAMTNLETQGLCYATPYWMRKDDPEGKADQLELTHSISSDYYARTGTRREYIGVKPERIQGALAAIERAEQYQALEKQCQEISNSVRRIEAAIDRLELITQGRQTSFWDTF